MGQHTLSAELIGSAVWGDCLDVLEAVGDASVDVVLTDPPYFTPPQQFVSNRSKHKRSLSNFSLLEHFYRDYFDRLLPKLKATGCVYIFCDERSYPLYWLFLYERVKKIRQLIWDKGTSVNGYSWRHQHIPILMAEMFDYPAIKTGDGDVLRHRSVPMKQRRHPAHKPLDLVERLVSKSCPAGGLVLDTFAGSFVTAEAAVKSGRQFIACDNNREAVVAAASCLDLPVLDISEEAVYGKERG